MVPRHIVIAAVVCLSGHAAVRADGPADALASCRHALADVRASSRFVRFERRGESWQVAHVALSGFDKDFDVGQLARLTSVESVVLRQEFSSKSPVALKSIDRLGALQNLRRLCVSSEDLTDGLAKPLARLPTLEELSTYGNADNSEQILLSVRALPKLRRLSLTWTGSTADLIELLRPLTDLDELDLGLPGALTNDALEALTPTSKLRVLRLSTDGTGITDGGLVHLKHLGELRELTLAGTRLGADGTAALEALPHLESLRCVCEGGAGTLDFSGLRSLRSLNIGVGRETNVRLPESVRELRISRQDIPNLDLGLSRRVESAFVHWSARSKEIQPDLAGLLALSELKRLKMRGASDKELKAVAGLASLRELQLEHSGQCDDALGYGYTDEGVKALAGLRELQSFKSNSCRLTNDGLAVLRNFKELRRLELVVGSGATEMGLESIRELKRLQFLRLWLPTDFEGSVDRLFALVSKLPDIEDFEIPGNITDKGLMKLGALKKLRRLNLGYNEGYSDDALGALMRTLPNLQEVRLLYRRKEEAAPRIWRFLEPREEPQEAL